MKKDSVKTCSNYGQLRTPMAMKQLFGKSVTPPAIGANTNIPKSAPRSAPIRSPLNAGTGLFKSKSGS